MDQSLRSDREAVLDAGRDTLANEAAALLAVRDALSGPLGEAFVQAVDRLEGAQGRAVVTGMGKSGHIARKIAATFASTGRPAQFVHPAEASHGDLGMITAQDCVLALSRSGETRELDDLIFHCRRQHIPLIGMTLRQDSTLAEASDVALVLPNLGEASEEAPAPTTSTTMCLAMGDALAVALLRRKGFSARDFGALHPGGKLGALLKHVHDVMRTGPAVPLGEPAMPVPAMLEEMTAKGLGCIGLVENGRLVGIVTDGDLRRRLNAASFTGAASALMTTAPRTIGPEAALADAIAMMNEQKIMTLFVVEEGAPVGVLHMHDLLTAGAR
jgi:arabinose-5-phosphate isomerase